jgi:ribokinase
VGDDPFGRELLLHLQQEAIHTEFVTVIQGAASGVAMITVSEAGENCIVVSSGANEWLTPDHVRKAEAIISTADILLLQLEIPMETVQEAVRLAKLYQVPVILNPAPARPLTADLLQQIDILTPNETEGRLIVTGHAEGGSQIEDIVSSLLDKGVKQVVMTLGGEGVAYTNGSAVRLLKAHKVEVADTTGAGDSLNGALGVYLAEGKSLEEAVHFAQKAAALSVTEYGAQSSMPGRIKVDGFEENGAIGGEK